MKRFTCCFPTRIIFGEGAELKVGDELGKLGAKRVFIVYGQGSVEKSGLLLSVCEALKEKGILWELFGGARPNPLLSHAKNGIAGALAFGADFILAVGGGSAIDTAKAIAHGTANPHENIWDYWTGEKKVQKSLPIASILTIPAAGSETSDSAVLTNDETEFMDKRGLSIPFNIPALAFMNPELTYTLPKFQLTCGIVDIMMHTMDRYFTPTRGNETTDMIAEGLLRTVVRNGREAMADPKSYDAMSEIMWCGSISHNGMTGLGAMTDFAPHMLGHELSAMFNVAHGASLSAIWGSWAQYCLDHNPARFAQFGRNVWGITESDDSAAGLNAIKQTVSYFEEIGAPVCFSGLGIGVLENTGLCALVSNCLMKQKGVVGNFRQLGEADVYEIYKLANH